MERRAVVLGAGYAGAAALRRLQASDVDDLSLTLVADTPHHLVRHEVHRVVRDPGIADHLTIPLTTIADPDTTVVEGVVTGIDTDDRRVALAEGDPIDYDFLLVALGSETAFYGIDGLAEHAHTLSSLDDALGIHEAVEDAVAEASTEDPAQVVVGGGGLSGIQTAGELAAYRDEHDAPLEVTVVEALQRLLPMGDRALQATLSDALVRDDVRVLTGDPIVEATADRVHFDERDPIPHDVLLWTGGIKGHSLVGESGLPAEHDRLQVPTTFRTPDERVFAVGDTALVGTDDDPVPPTAQAAMRAADVAAANLVRTAVGEPLEAWTYRDLGTLVSVGDAAFANDVLGLPTGVVDGTIARTLKKGVAARWIASLTSWRRALRAWEAL